MQLVSTVADTK